MNTPAPTQDKRYTLAEAARALSLTDMSVLYYIQYHHSLPERKDEQGNLYLLESDLHTYHQLHQQGGKQRHSAQGEAPALTREEALYREIGWRIRKERDELGFSQADLAQEIGLTRTSIVNIEAGRQRLPIHMLYAVAHALGVPATCLLPEEM